MRSGSRETRECLFMLIIKIRRSLNYPSLFVLLLVDNKYISLRCDASAQKQCRVVVVRHWTNKLIRSERK